MSVVAESVSEPPLFVDLDGTLVKTYLLLESMLHLVESDRLDEAPAHVPALQLYPPGHCF